MDTENKQSIVKNRKGKFGRKTGNAEEGIDAGEIDIFICPYAFNDMHSFRCRFSLVYIYMKLWPSAGSCSGFYTVIFGPCV